MSKSVKFKHPLLVQKINDSLSSPQKCRIPQNIDFAASSLVIVKSENRKFVCSLYYLNEVYDDKAVAFVDDSVEILPESSEEIQWVQEIELVGDSSAEFDEIKVQLHLNVTELNLDVIKSRESLVKLIASIVKHFKFSSGCRISCNRNGISRIFVMETGSEEFGTIKNAEIKIDKIFVDKQSKGRRITLGGLKNAQKSLETFINSNRNPDKFTAKPPCQALIVGPVGTGKTSLVHHTINTLDCIIFELSGDIFQPMPGDTEQAIESFFARIASIGNIIGRGQVIVVLIENIDVFCPKFNAKMKENSHSSRISSLIFSILDQIASSRSPTVVIGTTSKLEALNDGVRRSSRMGGCEIILDMPGEEERVDIIRALAKDEIPEDLLRFVAQSTPGYVGADLEVLCQFASRHLHTESLEINDSNLLCAFELAIKSIVPSVMRENLGLMTRSSLRLDSIGGMEELKKSLVTSVLGPLRHPEQFQRLGLRSPSGILLYGPSGCAKTTVVKCLAGESKMTLISVSSAEIYSPYVGEAEKFIVKLFNQARMNAPTILFFDEIDTIVGNRSVSGGGSDAHMRILSTLLTEIDGFGRSDRRTVMIVGATNKPQMIDDALMRPGRFDKLIHVPAPDRESRGRILEFVAGKMPIAADVDLESLAEKTKNFSGADLVNLCNEAAMCAATRDLNSDVIQPQDFEDVLTYLSPSLTEAQIKFYDNFENSHRRKA
jgi:SpoVK/Ycf46/Vps4 family AAA+-type ATPase